MILVGKKIKPKIGVFEITLKVKNCYFAGGGFSKKATVISSQYN
jgi:hypothetical protein